MKGYIDILDIATTFFLLTALVIYSFWVRQKHANEDIYKYFLPSFLLHLLGAYAFAIFYLNVGGDTQAYFQGANALKDLFYRDFGGYLSEIFLSQDNRSIFDHFSYQTGLPPAWIYKEPESWIVSKFYSIPAILGFSGFLGMTTLSAFFAHISAFLVFKEISKRKIHRLRPLMFALLAIPSVLFWTSGISKDAILGIGLNLVTFLFFKQLRLGFRIKDAIWLMLVSYFMLISIRSIMFLAVFVPAMYSLSRLWLRLSTVSQLAKSGIRIATVVTIVGIMLLIFTNGSFLQSSTLDGLLKEAEVTHNDFSQNKTYGKNRYEIEVKDFSLTGMMASMPASTIAGLYRPFIWEALIPSLFINGLESVVFIYFTWRLFANRKRRKILKFCLSNEILSYCLIATIFIAFFSGFSTIIFGVLVRIRSFALPFFATILLVDPDLLKEEERKKNSLDEDS